VGSRIVDGILTSQALAKMPWLNALSKVPQNEMKRSDYLEILSLPCKALGAEVSKVRADYVSWIVEEASCHLSP